jgi:outer membrane protein
MVNCLKPKKSCLYVLTLAGLLSIFLMSSAIAVDSTSDNTASDSKPTGFTDKPTNLIQIYELARENDPVFQSQRYLYESSPEIENQAWADLLPSVGFSAYYSKAEQEILDTTVAVYGGSSANYPSKGFDLRLKQPLFEYSLFKRLSQAKEEVKRAAFEFESAKQDLILRVAEAYIEVLTAHDNLEFTRAEEDGLKFHFELAKERYNNGLAPIMDFHDAKARYAYVTAQRVKAEYFLDDALESLAEITGKRIDNLSRLKFELNAISDDTSRAAKTKQAEKVEFKAAKGTMPLVNPDPDHINDWIDAALKQNFEIHIWEQDVVIARQEIARQKGGHYPTLEFVGRFFTDDVGGSLYGGSSNVETGEALVQVNIPIYEGGSVNSKVRTALKGYASAEENLKKKRREIKRETMSAFLGVKSAIKNTVALSQAVVSSQIALEAKRESYKSGLMPSLVVSDAVRDHYLSKRDFAKAQYEYIQNSLRLKKVVSRLDGLDLVRINQWLK